MKPKRLFVLAAGAAATAAAVLAGVYYSTLAAQQNAPAYTKPAQVLEKFDIPEPEFTNTPGPEEGPPANPKNRPAGAGVSPAPTAVP